MSKTLLEKTIIAETKNLSVDALKSYKITLKSTPRSLRKSLALRALSTLRFDPESR